MRHKYSTMEDTDKLHSIEDEINDARHEPATEWKEARKKLGL